MGEIIHVGTSADVTEYQAPAPPPLSRARAYVLRGHWVADCPATCGQTQWVFRRHAPSEELPCHCVNGERESPFYCRNCRLVCDIEWPPDNLMDEIMAPLLLRPNPANRNWYPRDHELAIRFGIPHGQSPAELYDENDENGVPGR